MSKHTPAKEHRRLDRERKAAQKKRRKLLEAAAPEMLKALKYALEYFKANDDGDDHSETYIIPRIKAIETAIRKARGE